MRVGFTGSHRTGKTTLIEALSAELPAFEVVDEPYRLLEDEGYEFADPPSRDDFTQQLRVSLTIARTCAADALVDRTPADFVAYLQASGDDDIDLDAVRTAMAAFDVLVFTPIEDPVPDRVAAVRRPPAAATGRRCAAHPRRGRHARPRDPVVEVAGDIDARLRQVLRALVSG